MWMCHDEKYDVLEAQSEKISKLEEKLDDTIAKLVKRKSQRITNQGKGHKRISNRFEPDTEIEKISIIS